MSLPSGSYLIANLNGYQIYEYQFSTSGNPFNVELYSSSNSYAAPLVDFAGVSSLFDTTFLNSNMIFYVTTTNSGGNQNYYVYGTDGTGSGTQVLVQFDGGGGLSYLPTAFFSNGTAAVFQVLETDVTSSGSVSYSTRIYETEGYAGNTYLEWNLSNTYGVTILPAPLVTQGAGASVSVGGAVRIAGLSVLQINTGSSSIAVTATAVDGVLSSSGGQGTILGTGSTTLRLSGTLSQIDTDLSSLSYAATTPGAGSVSVVATYAGASSSTEVSGVSVAAVPPALTVQTANQTALPGATFATTLPANTFTDPQGEPLTYTATLAAGAALPAWLTFNPSTRTFSGLVPADGQQTLAITVTATDTSRLSASETFSLTISGPASPSLAITSVGGPVRSADQTIAGTIDAADAGLAVSLYDGAVLLGTATPNTSGLWSAAVVLPLTQGAHVITARAMNAVGATGASPPVTYTLDTIPPVLAITSPGGATVVTSQTITGTIDTADAGLSVAIYDDATLVATTQPSTAGAWSATISLEPTPGPQILTAQAMDAAGNLGVSPPVAYTLRSDIPPADYNGDSTSDILIENTAGSLVVGELGVSGQETYALAGQLGPEWTFHGDGDFVGASRSQFLIESTSGVLAIGEVLNSVATYTQIGALGPEWTFLATGDFEGNGESSFLIENTSGAVVLGTVAAGGQAQYSQVSGLGPEWAAVGAGNFLGDGRADLLIENTSGAVVVGEIGSSGDLVYSQVAALGPEWTFVETGDFLGHGRSDFLIENTAGALAIGEVGPSGQAAYDFIGGLGPEWRFVGAGDFYGAGVDDFMIENTAGALVIGSVTDGLVQYAQVGGLGSEWRFRG